MVKSLEQYLSDLDFDLPDSGYAARTLGAAERVFVEKYLGMDALASIPRVDPAPAPALLVKPRPQIPIIEVVPSKTPPAVSASPVADVHIRVTGNFSRATPAAEAAPESPEHDEGDAGLAAPAAATPAVGQAGGEGQPAAMIRSRVPETATPQQVTSQPTAKPPEPVAVLAKPAPPVIEVADPAVKMESARKSEDSRPVAESARVQETASESPEHDERDTGFAAPAAATPAVGQAGGGGQPEATIRSRAPETATQRQAASQPTAKPPEPVAAPAKPAPPVIEDADPAVKMESARQSGDGGPIAEFARVQEAAKSSRQKVEATGAVRSESTTPVATSKAAEPVVSSLPTLRDVLHDKEEIQVVSFAVAGNLFLLPVEGIQEVLRHMELVKVPMAPDYVAGVINLRGRITPLVHLSSLLTTSLNAVYDESSFIIIYGSDDSSLGMIIDRISGVHLLPESKIIWNMESKVGDAADCLSALANLEDKVCGIVAPDIIFKKLVGG